MTRLIAVALAALLIVTFGSPAAAQFANVVRPAEPEAYAVRFGRDSLADNATAIDSVRRATRAELRAWVDSAAGALGVRLPLADTLPEAVADSLFTPVADSIALGDTAVRRDTTRAGIPLDTIRDRLLDPSRPPVSADSLRRPPLPRARADSIRADSIRRARPPRPPADPARQDGAAASAFTAAAPPSFARRARATREH